MKYSHFLLFSLLTLFSTAQNDLDFDMDVTNAWLGGYSNITYVITNNSSSDITNITINHPDALVSSFVLNPSTLAPGVTATATGRVAIAGNRVNGRIPFLGSTQATATGFFNGATITELSDGNDTQGNRVDDGFSHYFISEPQNYGLIFIDDNLNGLYDIGIDTVFPGAIINAADDLGNQAVLQTNETGWWYLPDGLLFSNNNLAVIDRTSFPAAFANYEPLNGDIPFRLQLTLASQFRYENGYVANSNIGTMEAKAFLDTNLNGMRDANEINVPNINFEFIANNDPATSTIINNGSGNPIYRLDFSPGVQLNDVIATTVNSSFFTVTTPFFDDVLTTSGSTTSFDFAISEVSSSNRDAAVYLTNLNSPNPGFESATAIVIDNLINGTATGTLQFNNDSRATITSVIDQNDTDLLANGSATLNTSGFSLSYSITDFEQQYVYVIMSTPVTGVQIGDTFTHTASINSTSIDNDATNNSASLDVVVIASFDPNDVTERRGETIPINTFSNTDYLEYTIRFQNLGTASAQFVRVLSDLNFRLDSSTFEMISTSHNYTYQKDGNSLDFFFDNIQLLPEVVDTEGSNGFIRYRIKPLPGYAAGDVIAASASIFFDYNAPVITETWFTTFDVPASLNDINKIAAYPIPMTGNTLYLNNFETGKAQLYSLDGKEIWKGIVENRTIKFDGINSGFYILRITSDQEITTIKLYKK